MIDNIIKFENVSKSFGKVKALRGLNLCIEEGQVFGLLGHNGAGKTTTLRMVVGLLASEQGNVSVFGLDPTKHGSEVRQRIGILAEDTGLYENLTPYNNLKFYGSAYRMYGAKLEERIKYLLHKAELWDKKDLIVKGFSRGMKKKLAIVRALLHSPKLLLLDEPSNGLDPISINMIHDDIRKMILEDKVTVVMSTHNLEEVKRFCDKITVIKQGENIFTSEINKLASTEGNFWTTITCLQNMEDYKNVLTQYFRTSNEIEDFKFNQNSLDIRVREKNNITKVLQKMINIGLGVYEVKPEYLDIGEFYSRLDRGEKYD